MADLRGWLAKVEALGELQSLQGVHWDLEMGVITELIGRQRGKPALLFDDIPGYPAGFRVLANALGSRQRFAVTMNLPQGLREMEMVQEWRRRSRSRPGSGLPPRFVEGGPVMENVLRGEEIDLLKFPVPRWHEHDGGRYIGTGDIVVTRAPNGDWVNLGTYRMMVHDRNHTGVHIAPHHHGRLHMEEWHARGEAMPVAVALGMDPLLLLVGSTELPLGASEYDYAGAIRGEPEEVIRGPITGLPIPAHAEIVLEGFIDSGELWPEGPFGEYTGYYGGGVRPEPVVRVEAIYHRNAPIILGTPPLRPVEARAHYCVIFYAAILWDRLEAMGVPDITAVWGYELGGLMTVVAVRQRYPGHAKQAARLASQDSGAHRFTIVVDEDIDVTDIDEVLWAVCTRVDPEKDIEILRESPSNPLDPIIPPERKSYSVAPRVVIDATRPYEWRDRFPEVVASSSEMRQQVLARWGESLRGII